MPGFPLLARADEVIEWTPSDWQNRALARRLMPDVARGSIDTSQ
jgi:hypothetical protein